MIFKKLTLISWSSLLNFFRHCLIFTVAMLATVFLKKGFTYDSIITLLEAALLFGLASGACRDLIISTDIRLFVERIGFFNIFLHGGLLYLVANILPAFQIDRFSTAFWGGVLINFFAWAISSISIFSPLLIKKGVPSLKQARAKVIRTKKPE